MRIGLWTRRCAVGRLSLALAGAGPVAACGDLTSGGFGEVEVSVTADSLAQASLVRAASFAVAPDAGGRRRASAVDGLDSIEGTVTVALRVYVRRGARDWVEVTEGEQVVTVPLQGGEAQIVARSDVPTGTYTEARARLSRVVADVEGGLIVDGEPVTGRVTVIESGIEDPLDLPRPLELEVEEGSLVSIVVELRSGLWIRRVDRDTRRVPPAELEEALRLRGDGATHR